MPQTPVSILEEREVYIRPQLRPYHKRQVTGFQHGMAQHAIGYPARIAEFTSCQYAQKPRFQTIETGPCCRAKAQPASLRTPLGARGVRLIFYSITMIFFALILFKISFTFSTVFGSRSDKE